MASACHWLILIYLLWPHLPPSPPPPTLTTTSHPHRHPLPCHNALYIMFKSLNMSQNLSTHRFLCYCKVYLKVITFMLYRQWLADLVFPADVDSFTVSLHCPNGRLLLRLSKGTVSDLRNTVEIPTGHVNLKCIVTQGNPDLCLNQPIINGWCQLIGGRVSYPTDHSTATRLGLCISLQQLIYQHPSVLVNIGKPATHLT